MNMRLCLWVLAGGVVCGQGIIDTLPPGRTWPFLRHFHANGGWAAVSVPPGGPVGLIDAQGTVLATLPWPAPQNVLGTIGDIDGDARWEFCVMVDQSTLQAISPATMLPLWSRAVGTAPGGAIMKIDRDIDGDGVAELRRWMGSSWQTIVGATGQDLGALPWYPLNASKCVGDVDGDGVLDYSLVGATYSQRTVHSGATGMVIPGAPEGDSPGDLDGDGCDEIAGVQYSYSSACSVAWVWGIQEKWAVDAPGFVCGLGDLNEDGMAEWMGADLWSNDVWIVSGVTEKWEAPYFVSSQHGTMVPLGDVDHDGRDDVGITTYSSSEVPGLVLRDFVSPRRVTRWGRAAGPTDMEVQVAEGLGGDFWLGPRWTVGSGFPTVEGPWSFHLFAGVPAANPAEFPDGGLAWLVPGTEAWLATSHSHYQGWGWFDLRAPAGTELCFQVLIENPQGLRLGDATWYRSGNVITSPLPRFW